MLFYTSSEFPEKPDEATYIILVFEKTIRKRRIARNKDKERLKTKQKLKRKNIKFNDEKVPIRESKMRRFCNYFMTIFNVRKLNPFV